MGFTLLNKFESQFCFTAVLLRAFDLLTWHDYESIPVSQPYFTTVLNISWTGSVLRNTWGSGHRRVVLL